MDLLEATTTTANSSQVQIITEDNNNRVEEVVNRHPTFSHQPHCQEDQVANQVVTSLLVSESTWTRHHRISSYSI